MVYDVQISLWYMKMATPPPLVILNVNNKKVESDPHHIY